MSQFLRPDANITQTSFTGGFAEIDEATASDADFAFTPDASSGTLEVGLSNPAASPGAGSTTIRYRLGKTNDGVLDQAGSNSPTCTVSLVQGTTVLASDTLRTVTTLTDYVWSSVDTSGVTDWNDVRLRFEAGSSGGNPTNRRGLGVIWAELEAPNASAEVAPSDGSIVLAGKVPTILLTIVLAAAAGALSFSGYAPTVNQSSGTEVVPSSGSIRFVGQAPTITSLLQISPDVGSVSLAGYVSTILQPTIVSPLTSSIVLSGHTSTITISGLFTPSDKVDPLAAAAENFLQKVGLPMSYNYNRLGYLRAIADVFELKAGISVEHNNTQEGCLLAITESVEALVAMSFPYNDNYAGYLRTIAEALEDYTGIPQIGSYKHRIRLSSEVIVL